MHNKDNKLRKFFAEKGYLFALALCVAALAVSGVLVVRSMRQADTSPVLSAPTDDPEDAPSTLDPTQDGADQPDSDSAESGETAETAALSGDEQAAETASKIVVWPLSGETVLPYAMESLTYHPTTQDWRTHDGLDIAAAVGTPVLAACAGTVESVTNDDALGTTVVIAHADGIKTTYANLTEAPTVAVGDTVAAGDTIGAVGQTASLEIGEEAHLHFAVSQNGESVDPTEYLP